MTYQPIENYGMVGDLHTVALVGMDGSIDCMAFPHFDSPTIFAALLDHRHGGRCQIASVLGKACQKQLYLGPDRGLNVDLIVSWRDTYEPIVFSDRHEPTALLPCLTVHCAAQATPLARAQ